MTFENDQLLKLLCSKNTKVKVYFYILNCWIQQTVKSILLKSF